MHANDPMDSKFATGPSMVIRLGEVELTLLASKTVWWPEKRTLFIADTHFGKAATMRRAGMPIPSGTTAQTLDRLTRVIEEMNAQRLVILGDFVHSAVAADDDFESELFAWRRVHAQIPLLLVKGNHDRRKPEFYERLAIETTTEPHTEGTLQLCHDVRIIEENNNACLGGHLHPGIVIQPLSRQPLPCFYRQGYALTLPAFGSFTGCARVQPAHNESCYAVAEDLLIQISHRSILH